WPASGTGIDPAAEWSPVTTTLEVDEAAVVGDADAWRRLRAAGHRALAHELAGITGVMLDLAVEHVSSRTQFGRPLGSFQAVKHKLADVRLWQECAVLASDAAGEPVDDHEAATAAAIAKVTANRFAETARQHCQQVLGGMGFTWEHDFHRYLKRALLLEPVLGSTEALHAELGAQLRAGTDPRLAMLCTDIHDGQRPASALGPAGSRRRHQDAEGPVLPLRRPALVGRAAHIVHRRRRVRHRRVDVPAVHTGRVHRLDRPSSVGRHDRPPRPH